MKNTEIENFPTSLTLFYVYIRNDNPVLIQLVFIVFEVICVFQ